MQHYLEESYLHIKAGESVAVMHWLGLAKTDAYRKGWETFAQMVEEKQLRLWLLDFSGGKVIDVKDQKWTTEEVLPKTIQNLGSEGLHKVAVILSSNIFNKIATRLIMGAISAHSGVDVAYFENSKAASEWLMAHDTKGAFV
ncbi:MAG: hypothetical protein JJT94_02360 [Bernardetiaceae bacterium]|nr:hypothetical protein [Bernardetiaceae bacterium]